MEVKESREGNVLTLALVGRLDSATSPAAEKEILALLEGVEALVLDFADLAYISSAGLRTLLLVQKQLGADKKMTVKNVSLEVMDILVFTGFNEILTIV